MEPIGGDCVRIYYALERDGAWDDQMTILMPIASVLMSAQFLTDSASGILSEAQALQRRGH